MLQISPSNQQVTVHQRRFNSPSSVPFYSTLTAALQASDSENVFPKQLSPVSQVCDLAGRGEEQEQYYSSFNASFPLHGLKLGQDLSKPLPGYDDAKYNAPQYDPPGPNEMAPWSPLRAFSAPEPQTEPFFGGPGVMFQDLQHRSPDALGSFAASWNSNHLQSPNMPDQNPSYIAANENLWTFDDIVSPPAEQEDYLLGHAESVSNFDRSRASSVSKLTYGRSPHEYPLSSNLSIDGDAIHNPFILAGEIVGKDKKADAAFAGGFGYSYQADNESLLNGLKSPTQQQEAYQYSYSLFNDKQDFQQWSINDAQMDGNLEGTTEQFPELPEENGEPVPTFSLEPHAANAIPIPSSSNSFNGGSISSPLGKRDDSSHQAEAMTSMDADSHTIGRARGITLPIASPSKCYAKRSALSIRCPSTKAKVVGTDKMSRRSSLNENRKPLSPTLSASNVKRGRRIRGIRLEPPKAEHIKRKRQAKNTCIRCRIKRTECDIKPGDSACQHCLKQGCRCIRADFADMTTAQTCNFIFQTSLSHVTCDGLRRITVGYPAIIEADWLHNQLTLQHESSDIEVHSLTGAVYKIKLSTCYEVLSRLPWQPGARLFALDDLVNNRRISSRAWLECMVPAIEDGEFEQLLKYTNMPNRQAYILVPLSDREQSRVLDIEDPGDRDLILMAAQLCRIVLRALELRGFKTLQQELGNITRYKNMEDRRSIVYRTGQLLGTLRWRLTWWQLSEKGSISPEYSDRVTKITLALYHWFLFAKEQLPEEIQKTFPKGAPAYYAETEHTFDDFPQDESLEGFQTWLLGAHSLIEESLASSAAAFTSSEQLIQMPNFAEDVTFQEPLSNWQLPMEPRKASYDDSETNLTWDF